MNEDVNKKELINLIEKGCPFMAFIKVDNEGGIKAFFYGFTIYEIYTLLKSYSMKAINKITSCIPDIIF